MGLSLAKNESISLKKSDGGELKSVTIGLGWDAASAAPVAAKKGLFGRLKQSVSSVIGGEIDLDASIISYGVNKDFIDMVSFSQLKSKDGAISHSGDNRTGDGDGDDEQIQVDLSRISPAIHYLAVVITSYKEQTFDEVENVFCRMVDNSTSGEVLRYDLRESGKNTAQVMAVLSRAADGWAFTAVGVPANATTPNQLVTTAASLLNKTS